jgi:hypothetical protein
MNEPIIGTYFHRNSRALASLYAKWRFRGILKNEQQITALIKEPLLFLSLFSNSLSLSFSLPIHAN